MSALWKWTFGGLAAVAAAVFVGMQQFVQVKTVEILESFNLWDPASSTEDALLKRKWYLTLYYMNQDVACGWSPAFEEYSVTFDNSPAIEGLMTHVDGGGRVYKIAGFKWPKKVAFTYRPSDDEGPGFGTYILQRVEKVSGGLDVYVGSAYVNACANTKNNSCDEAGPQKVCRATLSDKAEVVMNVQYRRHFNTPCVQIDGGFLGEFSPKLNEAVLR